MTSYEELTPDQRDQVDAFLSSLEHDLLWHLADYQADYIREHAANLVLTCVSFDRPINKGTHKKGVRN